MKFTSCEGDSILYLPAVVINIFCEGYFLFMFGIEGAAVCQILMCCFAAQEDYPRSLNSNGGWNKIGCMSFLNQPMLVYSDEIRSAVLMIRAMS